MTPELRVHAHAARGVGHVVLSGELDMAGIDQVEASIESLEALGVGSLVIDLSGVVFIDMSGVNLLLRAHDRLRRAHMELQIVRPPEPAAKVFRLSGTDRLLPFRD